MIWRALAVFWCLAEPLAAEEAPLELVLPLTGTSPYRVEIGEATASVTVDFAAPVVDSGRLRLAASQVLGTRLGQADDGWQRVAVDLRGPHALQYAELDRTALTLRLVLSPLPVLPAPGQRAETAPPERPVDRRPVIAIDPGHGGIDAGAVRDGLREADLMLAMAQELKTTLARTGRFRVVLTRNDNSYLRLSARVSRARSAGAVALISLHADALEAGEASGAVAYTLDEGATDAVARELVAQHDRADILGGLDLSREDDTIAQVLVDLAREGTDPASRALSANLLDAMQDAGIALQSHPSRAAAFSVLKAADIPSVLIELGFMSDEDDLANLRDTDWRHAAAAALAQGVTAWADANLSAP